MDNFSQDDIDKLLQDALVGGDEEQTDVPAPQITDDIFEASASQDDIDALFAAVGPEEKPENDLGQTKAMAPMPPMDPVEEAGEPTVSPEDVVPHGEPSPQESPLDPNDFDALFSDIIDDIEDSPGGDISSQDAIDELFSAMEGGALTPPPLMDEEMPSDDSGGDHLESRLAAAEAEADSEARRAETDFHELLSAIAGEEAEAPGLSAEAPSEEEPEEKAAEPAPGGEAPPTELDMNALLREVASAVPPPPDRAFIDAGDTTVLPPDISSALAEAEAGASPRVSAEAETIRREARRPAAENAVQEAGREAPIMPPPPAPSPAAAPEVRREFSVLSGAGEVESMAGQIGLLLANMAEKAQSYMGAWRAADSEAKELRARALDEERRRVTLDGEKRALAGQLEELRSRLAEVEGARVAAEESRRTLESSGQAKERELDTRLGLLQSETEALKDELNRARNQTAGVELESRRARFEVDRLKNEVEAERMERMRIQRALDNREKELQALQAQSSGQASSLFIDELHRLVRRLESELDARASGAHEALRQLDRLDTPESMVPVVSNLRAALMQALGQDGDADDALKSLGREASGIKGPASVAPAKAEMVSFETAIATYNLTGAVEVAGALLREASASPGSLMRKIYQCQSLRRPETAEHLADLARLLEGLRTVQESNDRTRGSETAESEIFYVHMFDFLHNLVRLKLISRLSGEIWRIFLDLRGRFSFVTSDRQWAEYRDKTLNS